MLTVPINVNDKKIGELRIRNGGGGRGGIALYYVSGEHTDENGRTQTYPPVPFSHYPKDGALVLIRKALEAIGKK
jgi:hypothetical protein